MIQFSDCLRQSIPSQLLFKTKSVFWQQHSKAGLTLQDFRPDLMPYLPPPHPPHNQGGKAQFKAWCNRLFVQIILKCVVSMRSLYCSQSSQSLPNLESDQAASDRIPAIVNESKQTRTRHQLDVAHLVTNMATNINKTVPRAKWNIKLVELSRARQTTAGPPRERRGQKLAVSDVTGEWMG